MAGAVAHLAALPARRRTIGSILVLVGLIAVAFAFRLDLSGSMNPANQVTVLNVAGHEVSLPQGGPVTAATTLKHLVDHPLAGGGRIATLSDFSFRVGVAAMAGAGLLVLIPILLGMPRSFIGPAAGIGLFGDALVMAVLVGEKVRLPLGGALVPAVQSAPAVIGAAPFVLAAGFAVMLIGGGLTSLRPLAGVFSGIGVALFGSMVGAALALVIGGDHIGALPF
jgi:hypothetical protein